MVTPYLREIWYIDSPAVTTCWVVTALALVALGFPYILPLFY